MFLTVKIKISAFIALFFVLAAPALSFQLTESVYSIPENAVELFTKAELHDRGDSYFNRERFGFSFGLFSRFSLSISFDYIQMGAFKGNENTLGDSSLRLYYYIGDFFNEKFQCGLSFELNLPTGPDVYYNEQWSSLALGRHSMSPAFICSVRYFENIFMHFSAKFTFREGLNDNFYGGFNFDMTQSSAYKSLFGLNPFSKEAFLSGERLKDDFITLSGAVNTDLLYPFMPYADFKWSFRPYRGKIATEEIPIEGAKLNPLLIGTGCRYFFSRETYLGIFLVVNPFPSESYTQMICGIEAGSVFLE